MKLNILTTAIISLFTASALAAKVDLAKSQVTWTGSKVVGSTHSGNIKLKNADIQYKDKAPQSARIVIDMTSITCTDIEDPKWNKKLVGHLNSDDFFSVNKFKTAEFKADSILKASDKFYLLKGKMTIKGKTQDVSLKAEVIEDKSSHQIVKVDFNFDRTKYGIKYGSGSFFSNLGDKMISDNVQMSVKLHISKK